MIRKDTLHATAHELTRRAAIEIPRDYLTGLEAMAEQESEDLSSFVLRAMLDNYKAAEEDARAMCADTGVPRYYVKSGNEARSRGRLYRAGARPCARPPPKPPRMFRCAPTGCIRCGAPTHDNNVGINAPEIEYSFEPDADWIEVTTVHKGGLFGTDYRMLFPGDGIDGIKRFFLDGMIAFGKRGLACQPAIVGIGLGGSKDTCMVLGKQAACLRIVGDRNPDPKIAELELELKELGNSIGMGAMGFVGKSMVVDCHIEVGYTHTGGMPMSLHAFCLSSRRASARIHGDGRVEHRTDPQWFTPYHRRNDVSWQPEAVKQSA